MLMAHDRTRHVAHRRKSSRWNLIVSWRCRLQRHAAELQLPVQHTSFSKTHATSRVALAARSGRARYSSRATRPHAEPWCGCNKA